MEWKCSRCHAENKDTYICSNCGFDESKNGTVNSYSQNRS